MCGRWGRLTDQAKGHSVSLALTTINRVYFGFCFREILLWPTGDAILQKGFALVPTECSRELLIWKTFGLT